MPGNKQTHDPDHVFPINGAKFFCEFKLKGSESFESETGSLNVIDFTKSAIVSLDIVDTIFEPFTRGTITVNNPFDYIEHNVKLKGDGRDILEMRLFQVDEEGTLVADEDERQLKYEFVIEDENNDISKTDRSNNFKTYSLVDVDYYKLNKAIPYNKKYNGLVGDIIKEILEEFDFEIDTDNWAPGDHLIQEFPEYIIPPQGWRYSDLIKYLLRINYNKSGDLLTVQSILKKERDTNSKKGKFSLRPLTQIFSDNKKLVKEAFTVNDLTDKQEAKASSSDNPNNPHHDDLVPFNQVTGSLNNTNLTSPMTRFTNEFFVNYTVSTHDPQTGVHYKDTIVIDEIKDGWEEAFVKVFRCQDGLPRPNLYVNEDEKWDNSIYKPFIMPFRQFEVLSIARAQMVSNLLFFNLQLNIDNIGNTDRRAGTFIDVFKLSQNMDTVSNDSKLLGRWFVTTLHHRFHKDKYQNVIQCIKPCIGPKDDPDERVDDELNKYNNFRKKTMLA